MIDNAPADPLVVLDEQECRELLTSTTVGYVAFVDGEGQQLLPVNFAVLDGDVYFRTRSGSVLAGLAGGHDDVAFGIHFAGLYQSGWNVTLVGEASGVEDPAVLEELRASGRPRSWAPGDLDVTVVIRPRRIGGRQVRQRG